MGRTMTGQELNWCLDALRQTGGGTPTVRLAVCGIPANRIELDERLKKCVDLLGVIDQTQAHLFARAMDIGLVPLEDNLFNWSRFPVRFAHFLAARTSVLCSEIGDLSTFSTLPGVLPAGKGREAWLTAFRSAVRQLRAGEVEPVDSQAAEAIFSWEALSKQLQDSYLGSL
jgi:hypothetical protein